MNVDRNCAGCGRKLVEGEAVVEVARMWFYCKQLCAIEMKFRAAA